ncbi:MAG: DUF1028 domain-containing protein [Planctomycetes bacterium]|nr:DUF1028 domain-containing protein [Planctomycetota bacterium]
MLARLLALLVLLGLPARLSATWSIILVNTRTGEIAVGCATCITSFDLVVGVPVIVVGRGAGCAQSFVDTTGQNRLLIRDQLRLGTPLAQILQLLAAQDPGHQTRQYGMVDVTGDALGFTGAQAGAWAGDRIGQVGDIVYAVQGNVLTGSAVLAAAELALFTTPGDMGQKLMAAMEAAASFGGDGRCSCSNGNPTGCGVPPAGFTKSAHIGFMIVSRPGDTDGTVCTANAGCATGRYYMRLNVAFQTVAAPDPVVQLRGLFDAWRLTQRGRPDHYASSFEIPSGTLPVDGTSTVVARVTLRDLDGVPLGSGGATVTVANDPTATATVGIGAIVDNGDGTYDVPLTAGTTPGRARLLVTVDDGTGPRQLVPATEVRCVSDVLWRSRAQLSAGTGGRVDFAIQPGAAFGAGKPFFLLASASGTNPGLFIPPFYRLPLNPDPLFNATVVGAFRGVIPELAGMVPATGFTRTSLDFPAGIYGIPTGTDVAFAYVLGLPTISYTSNAVLVRIVP